MEYFKTNRYQLVSQWGGFILLILMLINLYNIFIYVPTEQEMGIVQRIFYIHVPSAAAAFLAFFVVAGYSVAFLVKRKYMYDRIAYASAEIGIVFSTIVLLTGMLWARPIWNTWWTWDPRLTTMLILWFIYVAYLMLRDFSGESERGARFAAVFAIIGSVDIPIVYFSIRWWRTIHPDPVVLGGEGSGLHPTMLYTLLFSMFVFFILYAYLLILRIRVENTQLHVKNIKKKKALMEQ